MAHGCPCLCFCPGPCEEGRDLTPGWVTPRPTMSLPTPVGALAGRPSPLHPPAEGTRGTCRWGPPSPHLGSPASSEWVRTKVSYTRGDGPAPSPPPLPLNSSAACGTGSVAAEINPQRAPRSSAEKLKLAGSFPCPSDSSVRSDVPPAPARVIPVRRRDHSPGD